ncbi:hypothetical protein CI15_06375 [Paraburkholderia monticola]|uniref:Endonuclease GajA/Old nuclease/RecF-like AAA domain-containing protein n=1 Tax=Paraburkholderia monticola TaxID=1399968 RepID=A0A149PXS4_9BURK|nr:AAA family ATPase [Paraburkholderia monticola]KXU89809.1 hypothetical protein CI15_06375 [Paraburkholderia monticola]
MKPRAAGPSLLVLNVLVGENDAGKTSVIDAIRHVLLTTSYEFLRIQEHDFHIEGDTRAKTLWLEAEFRGLSKEQRRQSLNG